MSRIDEIKERRDQVHHMSFRGVWSLQWQISDFINNAPADVDWMLDRIAKLEAIKTQVQDLISWSDGRESRSGQVEIDAQWLGNLDDALAALDNDDEKETPNA